MPPTAAIAGGRCPAFEVFACQSALLELTVQKNLEEVPHTLVVVGVDVVVPLFEPRDEFGDTGQQRRQAFYDPALLFHQLSIPGGQRSAMLKLFPYTTASGYA